VTPFLPFLLVGSGKKRGRGGVCGEVGRGAAARNKTEKPVGQPIK